MSDVRTDPADLRLALERARSACRAFPTHDPSQCPTELADQLFSSLNEIIQLTSQLLAENEQFRARLHRTTTFPVPDNSGASAAL
jgi:hypothetical protein